MQNNSNESSFFAKLSNNHKKKLKREKKIESVVNVWNKTIKGTMNIFRSGKTLRNND